LDSYHFDKKSRIKKRSTFVELSRNGKKIHGKHFILNYRESQNASARLGITVSKRVGNAVVRNRIKRLCREFFRINRNRIDGNWDIHIIAKKEVSIIASQDIFTSLRSMFNHLSG